MNNLLVIDADSLIYRVGWSNVNRQYLVWDNEDREFGPVCSFKYKKDAKAWVNGEYDRYEIEKEMTSGDFEEARSYIDGIMDSILFRYRSTNLEIFISEEGAGSYRKEIDPTYKSNRDPSNKPPHYKQLFDHLRINWVATTVGGIEADDAVAITCAQNPEAICVSIDKDLNQIPGRHFNPNTKEEFYIDEARARTSLYVQALEGDTADDIYGVDGIGRKKALKLLEPLEGDERAMFSLCLHYYDGDYERLNKNLELLYLLRSWDDKWQPPITLEEIASEANSN